MVQIKRNSQEFKDVKNIFDKYEDHPQRKRSIKLYALRPFEKLEKQTLLNDVKENKDVLYNMAYESILDYFRSNKTKKLFREGPGKYYFKENAKSQWIEYPFELSASLRKNIRGSRLKSVKD
jgi:hypothetical protein